MLDLGFLNDVENLVSRTHELRQTMLFSATMPSAVVALARRYMRHPMNIRAESPDEGMIVPATAQFVYRAHAMDKVEMLARILQAENRKLVMIFCRTKRTAQKVADELDERGFASAAVHGDLGQGAREQALRAFRAGKVDVLVATDVAARGIDVEGVTHVINYQCPEDEKTYLHRIGRTGRAGASGIAITFVDWDDLSRWSMINTALDLPYPEPEETYSTSPKLAHDLGIPPGVTGRLPRSQRTRAGLGAEELEDLGETGKSRGGASRDAGRAARGAARANWSRWWLAADVIAVPARAATAAPADRTRSDAGGTPAHAPGRRGRVGARVAGRPSSARRRVERAAHRSTRPVRRHTSRTARSLGSTPSGSSADDVRTDDASTTDGARKPRVGGGAAVAVAAASSGDAASSIRPATEQRVWTERATA